MAYSEGVEGSVHLSGRLEQKRVLARGMQTAHIDERLADIQSDDVGSQDVGSDQIVAKGMEQQLAMLHQEAEKWRSLGANESTAEVGETWAE